MHYPPSVSFGEGEGLRSHYSTSTAWHDVDEDRFSEAGSDSRGRTVPLLHPSLPTSEKQRGVAWSVDVLQWERNKAATTSTLDSPSPFSLAVPSVSPLSAPLWLPFRTLSWHPREAKVKLRTSPEPRPAPSGDFVFDQTPGSGGLSGVLRGVTRQPPPPPPPPPPAWKSANGASFEQQQTRHDDSRRVDDRNSVSLSTVARMDAVASPRDGDSSPPDSRTDRRLGSFRRRFFSPSSPTRLSTSTDGAPRPSRSGKREYSGETRRHRAIQFKLGDVRYVQRYCFSTPRTVELTSQLTEWSDERRTDPVAYRFCLFGPVGLIIRLRGGFEIFLVFRNVREAEEVHAFLQHETERDQRKYPDGGEGSNQSDGAREAGRPQRRVHFFSAKKRRLAEEKDSGPRAAAAAAAAEASRDDIPSSRVEGSSVLDSTSLQSSHQQSGVSNGGTRRHLRLPNSGCIHLRPLLPTQPKEDERTAPAADPTTFQRLHVRPSRITRKHMRGVPAVAESSGLNDNATSPHTNSQDGSHVCAPLPSGDGGAATPLNVHLTRSRTLWWQRLKHKVSRSFPATVTVDLRHSRVVNLSSGGSSLAWHVEVPMDHPIAHDKSLDNMVGVVRKGPSMLGPDVTVWHAAWEVALPSPAIKEAWLRWFELMGVPVEWTQPSQVASAPSSEPVVESANEPAHVEKEAGDASSPESKRSGEDRQEPWTPEDVVSTALPSPDSVAGDVDRAMSAPSSVSRTRTGRTVRGDVGLRDTSSSSSSASPLSKHTDDSAEPEEGGQGATPERTAPALPLKEEGIERGDTIFRESTETVTVDLPAAAAAMASPHSEDTSSTASPSPPASPPPPAIVEATLPTPFRQWRKDVASVVSTPDQPTTQAASDLSSPAPMPPDDLPPWRKALVVAYKTQEQASASPPPREDAGSPTETSLSSVYCSPDMLEDPQGRPDEASHQARDPENKSDDELPDDDDDDGRAAVPRRSHTRAPPSPSSPSSATSTPVVSAYSTPHSARTPGPIWAAHEECGDGDGDAETGSPARTIPTELRSFLEETPSEQMAAAALADRLFPPQEGKAHASAPGSQPAVEEGSGDSSIPPPPSSELSSASSSTSDLATPRGSGSNSGAWGVGSAVGSSSVARSVPRPPPAVES